MPLFKKPSLSKDDMQNYRQVSNQNFVSKIIEQVIELNRTRSHLERNDLSNQCQGAYKKTILFEKDIILNMDEGSVTSLTLFDLSAAFDTLDHSRITDLLSTWHAISFEWFVSYLSGRKEKVKLIDCLSSPAKSRVGFPKDSSSAHCCLLSTPPLGYVIQRHNVNLQLCINFP